MDYRTVAALLRVKADAVGVSPEEAATLRAKAAALEAKYGPATPPPDPPKHTYAPPPFRYPTAPRAYWHTREQDIVEEAYRYAPDDY